MTPAAAEWGRRVANHAAWCLARVSIQTPENQSDSLGILMSPGFLSRYHPHNGKRVLAPAL